MNLEDRFLQAKVDMFREAPEPTPEAPAEAEPMRLAMGGSMGARGKGPQSVGEFVSDVAAPLGAMVDMGAATVKGMAQGFAGLPGDLEGLTRTVINLLGGSVDENTKLPTTDEIKTWLDQFPITRVGGGKNPYEKLGEFAAPGGYAKVARPVVKGASKGVRVAAPVAGRMAEQMLDKQGLLFRAVEEAGSPQTPLLFASEAARKKFKDVTDLAPEAGWGMLDYFEATGSVKKTLEHMRGLTDVQPNEWLRNHSQVAERNKTYKALIEMVEKGEIKLGAK